MANELIPSDPENLGRALEALEGVKDLRDALRGEPAWLVGGAVRDLLLGRTRADIDLVVEGEASVVAADLGAAAKAHERFGTASVAVGEIHVDVAAARSETYAAPGALPEVRPASLADDLARRDFTINAMALPLNGDPELVDPHGGRADLEAGVLRILHVGSFRDDPTRALRAARYLARLDLKLDPETERLLRAADLGTVSQDRITAELRRTLAEERAPEALELLADWGLAGVDDGAAERIRSTRKLLTDPAWAEVADPSSTLLEAVRPSEATRRAVAELTRKSPARPSEGVALLENTRPVEAVIARVAGAEWLDEWAHTWRRVELEIDGGDLLDAGVAQGPAVGQGLAAALAARLDGEISTRAEELRVAVAAAAAT